MVVKVVLLLELYVVVVKEVEVLLLQIEAKAYSSPH